MTTDAHFAAALNDRDAARKTAEQAHAGDLIGSPAGHEAHEKTPVYPGSGRLLPINAKNQSCGDRI
jgi:hypothetical protein